MKPLLFAALTLLLLSGCVTNDHHDLPAHVNPDDGPDEWDLPAHVNPDDY